MKNNFKKVSELENYEIYQFTPTIFDLFSKYYPEKINLRRIIRFMLALRCGYEIYYLLENDKTVAYCVTESGASKRFEFSCERDFLLGPLFVSEEYRGHSLGAKFMDKIINIKKANYENIYSYIKKDNIASIKSCEKIGLVYYAKAVLTSIMANVKITDNDNTHIIVKYEEK